MQQWQLERYYAIECFDHEINEWVWWDDVRHPSFDMAMRGVAHHYNMAEKHGQTPPALRIRFGPAVVVVYPV
jgi:hypothetical protein